MNKKILLILSIIFTTSQALADEKSYGPIIQRQAQQIQELKSRVLELENTIGEINTELKRGESTRINEASVQNIIKDTKSSEKGDYDLALATLKEGDFVAAETKFFDFITNYPSSQLRSNATFWYSETFYRRDMFDKAAINYLQSYKKHPKGPKASDALLKLAYSLAGLNKNKEACSMLKKLESEFPDRSVSSIKRTKEAKDNFYCK